MRIHLDLTIVSQIIKKTNRYFLKYFKLQTQFTKNKNN